MKSTTFTPLAAVFSAALVTVLTGCPGGGDAGKPAATGGAGAGTGAPAAAATVDPAKAASVSGAVKFEGAPPAPAEIDMSGTPECHAAHAGAKPTSEALLVKDGKLKNVIVYVKEGLTGSHNNPQGEVVLDQKGCMYSPHVVAMQTNQPLKIKNSDPTTHNVHALPKKNEEFNSGQPQGAPDLVKKFKTPEIVKFRCDVHSWMSAYVGVFDHPFFAVTDDAGNFSIKGLPPGSYTLEAWHEKFASAPQTLKVTVGEKENKTGADFTFKQ